MKNSKVIILLLVILAIASFLRLYSLDSAPPGLYADEAVNGNNAVAALEDPDGFKAFYTENNGREGLFMNIQAVAVSIFGNDVWPLRLPSALFGIITVLGVYFLTKELFGDKNLSLFAALLVAVSFWHINFSRIAFRAIMAPAFLTWGLYLFLKIPRVGRYKTTALAGGLIYGLGMHSYIAYRATPLLIVFVLWLLFLKHDKKKILKGSAIFIAASIIAFLPLGLYFLENPAEFFGRTGQISVLQSPNPIGNLTINTLKTAGMFNVIGDWNPRHNVPGAPLLWWPVGILFLVGVIISIKKIFKDRELRTQNLILFAWLIIASLPVIVSNEGLPHALRSILMVTPIFILAALGGAFLYEKIKIPRFEQGLKTALVFGFAIAVTVNAYSSYFTTWAKNPATESAFNKDIVQIGEEINRLPKETSKYVVIDTGGHDIRKVGTPAQTIMYITDTYNLEKQKEKNVFYVPTLPDSIPENSFVIEI